MNFSEFQIEREALLRDRPGLNDCAETNLYRALARLAPPPTPTPTQQVHRCHLASEWYARFGFSDDASRRALISCGVRDSLARLLPYCAQQGALMFLPADNYPVYGEIARAAGCRVKEFPTLPAPSWPQGPPTDCDEILVVTNPLKPLGRYLCDADVAALKHWLSASPRRRVWLDAVYTFDTRFDRATLSLLATDQVVLLHSLTKGWLQPRLFGVALVPQADAAALTPLFRQNPPPQPNLARARDCLSVHADTPCAVGAALHDALAAQRCSAAVGDVRASSALDPSAVAPGYFTPVRADWRRLLAERNVLGLPATVFGSTALDITILSSLSFAR